MRKQFLADLQVQGRRKTPQGYMVFPSSVIGRTGVQHYDGAEVGELPGALVALDRPEREVFRDESVASFEGMPVTWMHPADLEVTAQSWRTLAVGVVTNVRREGDHLVGDVWVHDHRTVAAIEREGVEELSLGYSCDLVDGGDQGAHLTQTNIKGNHVAIVPRGRCGGVCRLGDGSRSNQTMKKKRLLDALFGLIGLTKPSEEQRTQLADAVSNLGADPDVELEDDGPTPASEKVADSVPVAPAVAPVEPKPMNDAALSEANTRIADLELQLSQLRDAQADATEMRSVAADAGLRFPQLGLGDATTAREIRERVVVHKGLYTADAAKSLTDCDLKAAYQAARTLRNDALGKAILGDASAHTKLVDYNSLYRS